MEETPNAHLDDIKAEIANELYEAAQKLGATSDLLGIIGSWGDTREDEDVRDMLVAWNDRRKPGARRAENDQSVTGAIRRELYVVFENLGAPIMLLGELGSWGDGNSDKETLLAIRQFNRWGRTFDTIDAEVDDIPGATMPRADDPAGKPS